MAVHQVLAQYEGRLTDLQTNLAQIRLYSTLTAAAGAAVFALILVLSVLAMRQRVSILWPSLPVPLAVALTLRFRRYSRSRPGIWRLRCFYQRAVQRAQGNWAGNGVTGVEYSEPGHVYASDLNVFGLGSLFELVNTARTAIGQRGLAQYLTQTPPIEESLLRQEAVRELTGQLELRERLVSFGRFELSECKWETFTTWLDSPALLFQPLLRVSVRVISLLLAVSLAVAVTGVVPRTSAALWIAPLLVFHSTVGLIFRKRVRRMLASLSAVSVEIQVLREGLQFLEIHQFQSAKLRQLTGRIQNSSQSMRKLERLLKVLHERNKEGFYGFSLLFLTATQLCMAIEQWRVEHRDELRIWLDAWGEFEALNSLATYAYENPDNTFPEFSPGDSTFVAEALGHPLLPGISCVRNDIQLDQGSRFYLISGSNMSGKSTLMRAIGMNTVLAQPGAPVRAHALRLSRLSVCASLSVVDSLLNGKSKFMAEVDRLRQTIETAMAGEPVLFLIDEIFSGTNSPDRRVAAEALVRTLIDAGAIGVLSTHDLALTEIANTASHGVNVHTGSRDGTDPMDFDYRLKPGVTQETNALAIARLAGVPI